MKFLEELQKKLDIDLKFDWLKFEGEGVEGVVNYNGFVFLISKNPVVTKRLGLNGATFIGYLNKNFEPEAFKI